jgi:hypothetical protein
MCGLLGCGGDLILQHRYRASITNSSTTISSTLAAKDSSATLAHRPV